MKDLKMKRIDVVLKELSDLYEFNRKLTNFELKEEENKSDKEDQERNPHAS